MNENQFEKSMQTIKNYIDANKGSGSGNSTTISWDNVTGKPTIPSNTSDLTNDSGFITINDVPEGFDGDYNSLTNRPTIPTVTNDLTNELKSNYDTAYTHSQSAHAPSNAQKNSDITKAEIEAKLTGDISTHTHSQYLTSHQDLSDYALKTELHNHTNKTILDNITSDKVASWDNKSDFSGNYNDLTNKPTIPSIEGLATEEYVGTSVTEIMAMIPTTTSKLTNDSGFITSIPSEYITETELEAKGYSTFSGSYNDLTNKPTIPSAYTHPSTHPASMITGLSTVATSGSYNDLSNKPTSLPANGGNANTVGGYTIWSGTQAQFDAIVTKDANTIYLVKEG